MLQILHLPIKIGSQTRSKLVLSKGVVFMTTRETPNWIALGCASLYLIGYLFLPFYTIVGLPLNGLNLMQHVNAIMCIPLILALVLGLASVVLDPRVSVGIGIAAFIASLILLLTGRPIVTSGNALVSMGSNALAQYTGLNIGSMLPVSAGIGAILCLILIAVYVAVELLMNSTHKKTTNYDNPFAENEYPPW